MSKEHAMLLSVFLVFKFLSKDLIIAALTAYFIRGTAALCVTLLPSIKRFLTKGWNYKEIVWQTPLIDIDFIKLRIVASIPGIFFCLWYAAKKHCLANNVLGISFHIQGIGMLSLGSFKACDILLDGTLVHDIFLVVFTSVMVRVAPIELLFPTAVAARSSSIMLTLGDTVIPGIFVALALHVALPKRNKNHFFNCAFLRWTVGLTVAIIIMNWFQATQDVQPALLYVAAGVVGLVAVHWLWDGELKQKDVTNQLMGKLLDWNDMYGTKLGKFDGHTAHEDGDGREDDATTTLEDGEGGHDDGRVGLDDAAAPSADHGGAQKDCGAASEDSDDNKDYRGVALNDSDDGKDDNSVASEDSDDGKDDSGSASEDSDDDILPYGQRVVQLLAIRANFPIRAINGYDWQHGRSIYRQLKKEVQEEGMVDLVLLGPRSVIMAYGCFGVEVFPAGEEGSSRTPPIKESWDVLEDEELVEYTQTISGGPGRKMELTFLVIPSAIEGEVEVRLKLKDLGFGNRAVYGNIKASANDYGNKSVYLFSCERGSSLSVPSSSVLVLPLSPSVIALPYRRQLELHIEVDMTIITIPENQEEDKDLKFTGLKFTHGIRSQEREVDDDQVEVNITWHPKYEIS